MSITLKAHQASLQTMELPFFVTNTNILYPHHEGDLFVNQLLETSDDYFQRVRQGSKYDYIRMRF